MDQARRGEGVEGEDRGRGDAAGPGNEGRIPNLFAMNLGKAVDRLGQQLRMRVVDLVIGPIQTRVFQAEVRAEVDDFPRAGKELRNPVHRPAVGHCEEEEIARVEVRMRRESQVGEPSEVRVGADHGFPRHGVGRDLGDVHLRMAQEQPQELASRVSGAADD